MSWIFPVNRPRWQRQGYIFLGILLAVSANLMDISLDLFVYLYIAKSCFLLNRKSVLPIVVIAVIAWVSSEIWSVPESLPKLPLHTSHQIYCIVKEALINIQKHACASHIRFRGQSTPEGNTSRLRSKQNGIKRRRRVDSFASL